MNIGYNSNSLSVKSNFDLLKQKPPGRGFGGRLIEVLEQFLGEPLYHYEFTISKYCHQSQSCTQPWGKPNISSNSCQQMEVSIIFRLMNTLKQFYFSRYCLQVISHLILTTFLFTDRELRHIELE